MGMPHTSSRIRQRGLTMIEFMVSIAIGMIVVAALATLIADQSGNRAEVDRAGRLIENGRYAIRAMADDLQMAGYWGELTTAPAAPAAWATPCGAAPAGPTQAEIVAGLGWHVSGLESPLGRAGYNDATAISVEPACLTNVKPGTDIVVLRWADADSTPYETAGAPDTAKLSGGDNATRLFVQTGLDPASGVFTWKVDTGANHASLNLVKKDKATKATVRKLVVRMYYVSTCSVCTGPGADTIPSLKMKELAPGLAWSDATTISEGIENLQIEYGLDSAVPADGAPDGADTAAGAVAAANWPAAVSAKIYLVSRSVEPTPQYDECSDPANVPASCKTYSLGMAGIMVPTGTVERAYKRHVFVQSVRLVNPGYRRSL